MKYKIKFSWLIAKAASNDAADIVNDAQMNPNLRPILLIIFAAKTVKIAVPTTYKAVGSVDKIWIEVILEPIIPLKKTVIVAAVKPNTWLRESNKRFLFIRKYIYLKDKRSVQ